MRDNREKPLVIALGNEFRCDDGLGPAVLRALGNCDNLHIDCLHHSGDPVDLISCWQGRMVVVVDVCKDEQRPVGEQVIFRPLEARTSYASLPRGSSSHSLSLMEAIELGKILAMLPRTLIVLGCVGRDFGCGTGLSPAVSQSVDELAARCIEICMQYSPGNSP